MRSPYQVAREAVCLRLCDPSAPRLTLVRAPAGFGKSTVMRQSLEQLQQAGVATAWVTVDASDNDVSRFLSYVAAAIARLSPTDQRNGEPDAAGARTDGELALRLMESVAGQGLPFVLFLDDFESVQNTSVLGLVREIIDYLPSGGRLVIGSRNVPDLGFAALRARGALMEIEPEDLRFTPEESRDFLRNQRGLTLSDPQVARLHARTEGWAAALWLASLALERRPEPEQFIAEFSGSSSAIADYLAEDVLAHLPERLQEFLLRTSLLDQLTPSLCDAVTGRQDSRQRLQELEHRNLFLVPQDDQRQWYRYHSLFADFLRAQCRRTLAEEIPELHRRAARWYCAHNRPIPAIENALAAGDYTLALPMLSDHAEQLLLRARFRLLVRWLDSIPEEALSDYPVLRQIHVWATAYSRGYLDALKLLERVDADPRTQCDPDARTHRLAAGATLMTLMDRPEQGYREGKQNLRTLRPERSFAYSMLTNAVAYLAMILGHYQEARALLDESRRTQNSGHGLFDMMYSESVEAIIDLLQGRLRQAVPRFQLVAGQQAQPDSGAARGSMMAGIPLAEVLYESDECERAERLLNVYVPLVKVVRLPDQLISGHIILARLAANRGQIDQARQILTELEYLGHHGQLARVVSSARLERVRLHLVLGEREAAAAELARARDIRLWRRIMSYSMLGNDVETLTLGRLRLILHGPRPTRAIPVLRRALEDAGRARRLRRALKLRILLAWALKTAGQDDEATSQLDTALTQAAAQGFIRMFLDEGTAVTTLVRDRLTQLSAGLPGPVLPKAFIRKLLQATGAAPDPDTEAEQGPGIPAEALTRKEREVLALLAEGGSNLAIAQRLFVSETTVRTHLRNINAKLNARNRTQAVAIARRLGLIS
ncbi:MAG: AAA family ATPase [Ectothiorhodospiraceae bacterium]|nr:AAA family ATPase [Ectothiorhodospiraceae bacterium]